MIIGNRHSRLRTMIPNPLSPYDYGRPLCLSMTRLHYQAALYLIKTLSTQFSAFVPSTQLTRTLLAAALYLSHPPQLWAAMDAFTTIEFVEMSSSSIPTSAAVEPEDNYLLLVDADTKLGYPGYCVVAWAYLIVLSMWFLYHATLYSFRFSYHSTSSTQRQLLVESVVYLSCIN